MVMLVVVDTLFQKRCEGFSSLSMYDAQGGYSSLVKAVVSLEARRSPHKIEELSERFRVPIALIHQWQQELSDNEADSAA